MIKQETLPKREWVAKFDCPKAFSNPLFSCVTVNKKNDCLSPNLNTLEHLIWKTYYKKHEVHKSGKLNCA